MASTWGENDEVVASGTEEVKVQSTWGENDEVETEEKSDPNNMWAIALRTALSSVPGFGDIGLRKPDYDPEASEGLSQEMFEGVGSGLTKIVQGVGETAALVPDLALGTDLRRKVTKAGEDFREAAGIDPVGVTASLLDVGTQFVGPGGLAIKIVTGPLKALTFFNKAKRIGKGVAAAGITDAIVSTEGTQSLGNLLPDSWFGGEITNTEDDIGLEGRQEALRALRNKLRIGFEGGVAQAALPPVISTLGQIISKTAVKPLPIVQRSVPNLIAGGIKRVKAPIDRGLANIEEVKRMGGDQGPIKKGIANTLSFIRPRGILPESVAGSRFLVGGVQEAETRTATLLAEKIDQRLAKVIKKGEEGFINRTPGSQKAVLQDIESYLLTPNKTDADMVLTNLPKSIHTDLSIMRSQLTELQKQVASGDFMKRYGTFLPQGAEKTIKETVEANIGEYMRKQYRVYTDDSYRPSKQTLKIAREGFATDPKAVQDELDLLAREASVMGKSVDALDYVITTVPNAKQINMATENFLKRHRRRPSVKNVGRSQIEKLDMGLFAVRKDIPEYKKALLGEVTNPLERYLSTVASLSEFKAVDDYFGSIRQMATDGRNPGVAKLFRDTSEMTAQEQKVLTDNGYVVLGKGSTDDVDAVAKAADDASLDDDAAFLGGLPPPTTSGSATDSALSSGWGSLDGFAVPKSVFNSLTRRTTDPERLALLKATYSLFLKGKAATQYGKTILSPATQIRNVTTAAGFVLANGNVGKGANILESMRLVFDNFGRLGSGEQAKLYKRMQELGVVGSQAQLKELQALLEKGFAPTGGAKNPTKFGSDPNETVVKAFSRKISKPVKGKLKTAENLYQAGDDIWKIYSYMFEQRKLMDALSDLSPRNQADYLNSSLSNKIDLRNFDALNPGQQKAVITDLLEQESAAIVRNTVPNYNMTPEAIKELRKLPLGSFVAFPYEIMRTSVNILGRGIDEMASSNPKIQEIGLRRLTGLATSVNVMPNSLQRMGRHTSGGTEEQDAAYQRSFAAPWNKNATLMHVEPPGSKHPEYVNLSYSMPYDMLQMTVNAALNSWETDKKNGVSTERTVFNAVSTSLNELLKPFLSESIALEAIRDITPRPGESSPIVDYVGGRGGRSQTGAEIYDSQDSIGDKAWKSMNHLTDALLPNIVPLQEKSGKFVPSRFAQGFLNSLGLTEEPIKDRMGRERKLTQELARVFSGIGQLDTDMAKEYQYKGYDLTKKKSSSATMFNSVARRPNVTSEQLLEAYKDMTAARRRNMTEFYVLSQDAKTLGFSIGEQKRLLKEAGVSGFDEALRGRFKPLDLDPGTLKIMKRNGTFRLLPRSEIKRIQIEEKRIRLGPQDPPVKTDQSSGGSTWGGNDTVVEPQSSFQGGSEELNSSFSNLAPPAVTTPPNIQVSQASSVPLSPSLLGDSRNMDIANRLGRA